MSHTVLLFAVIFIWIGAIAGVYQSTAQASKWFSNPPASFELIRLQSQKARLFWIAVSFLFLVTASISLYLFWYHAEGRTHIIASLICFSTSLLLGAVYLIRELFAFMKIPSEAGRTQELIQRTKYWRRWSFVRNALLIVAAMFITIAWNHV